MELCVYCLGLGYCRNRSTPLVTNAELEDEDFRRGVRRTANAEGLDADEWCDWLNDTYRDHQGWVSAEIDGEVIEVFLDMGLFETADATEWFRYFCCTPLDPDARPRLTAVSKERIRVLATILRMRYPVAAMTWSMDVANNF